MLRGGGGYVIPMEERDGEHVLKAFRSSFKKWVTRCPRILLMMEHLQLQPSSGFLQQRGYQAHNSKDPRKRGGAFY